MMRRVLLLMLVMAMCSVPLAGRNLADYPLRVQIFQASGVTHSSYLPIVSQAGEGTANLYENGDPYGLDFKYDCTEEIRASRAWDTFPAKWKKRGQRLEVLLPKIGQPNGFIVCQLFVTVHQDIAFFPRGYGLAEVPVATMKKWMQDCQYDPEHGRNTPIPPGAGVKTAAPAPDR